MYTQMSESAIRNYEKNNKLGPMKDHVLNEHRAKFEESRKLIIQADEVSAS